MEVAAWWLVYGRSPSFVVRSVMIPSVVHPTMLSADAKSSEGVIVDDIVGGPVLLPKVSSTETVHVFVAILPVDIYLEIRRPFAGVKTADCSNFFEAMKNF